MGHPAVSPGFDLHLVPEQVKQPVNHLFGLDTGFIDQTKIIWVVMRSATVASIRPFRYRTLLVWFPVRKGHHHDDFRECIESIIP